MTGVLIKIENAEHYTVNFGPLGTIAQNNGVLKSAHLVKNSFGQVTTAYETFKWYNPTSNKVIFGYNAELLPPSYRIFGKLHDQLVFDLDNGEVTHSPDPGVPAPSAFWALIIAAAAVVAAVFDTLYSKTTTTTTKNYDANGNYTGGSTTTTTDPEPFEIEINGTTHMITDFGIKYDTIVPPELIGYPSTEPYSIGEQITGTNLSSFQITSIHLQ
ncbi:MAG: hypothetical protein P0Y49_14125 [Candidatus Pedobacter colombiensis]|uniref:Uncharacterized protein n=1 Tax=Candidatus Pedobacter colombiensis TaxID=3121371 RepID=A0AAJ5W6A6_9SPHI|nr:hypothetical protein [Pedobacter sp.]WEK17935.1 MAG: hypothetical protein P0Y49_14125 [Pedobacter sp.]